MDLNLHIRRKIYKLIKFYRILLFFQCKKSTRIGETEEIFCKCLKNYMINTRQLVAIRKLL